MGEVSTWLRVAVGFASLCGTFVGLMAWMWRIVQRQSKQNTQSIAKIEGAAQTRFLDFEEKLTSLEKEVSHRATHDEIAKVHERLSGIEANQRSTNNILGVIHQHILRER